MENGTKFIPTRTFFGILTILVIIILAAYGYSSSRITATEEDTHNNEVMLGRFEEKFNSIEASLQRIEKTLNGKSSFIIKD